MTNDSADMPAALPKSPAPVKTAKIRCLDSLKARGFTFAKGKVVEGISLPYAEKLEKDGKAEIIDII